ncbi:hypothetical protein TeGR_g9423, partial [Tetraparma gracilis]
AKNEIYTDAENAVVNRVRDQLGGIPDSSFEKFESPDHLVKMGVFHKGGKNGTPRASTVFDEEICTYVSKMRKRFDQSPAIDAASSLRLETMIQIHDEPYTEEEEEMLRTGVARFATFDSQKGKELKMDSPSTKAKIARALSDNISNVRNHFQEQRGLEDWDEKDGEAVGDVLVTKTDTEKHPDKGETRVEARVKELMEKQKGLKELGQKHEWFKVLLAKVVANKLRPAGDSKAKLCNMSVKEANVIGGALASCIAANLTAPAAVDEWILRYPAMGGLEREYVWFRPMMDTIAQRLLESVGWGLKMRLYTGAGLSTLDLLSDLYMIYTYATTGQQGAALSLAVMVGLCLLAQLFAGYLNLRKGPKLNMLKEMLIVLSGTA